MKGFEIAGGRRGPVLTAVVAGLLLAVLLGALTYRNIQREENLLREFMLAQGLTLIRGFEAGARSSLFRESEGGLPPHGSNRSKTLETLVGETALEETVAFIRIESGSGKVLTTGGSPPPKEKLVPADKVLVHEHPVAQFAVGEDGGRMLVVAREFKPAERELRSRTGRLRAKIPLRWRKWLFPEMSELDVIGPQVIRVGIYTQPFDQLVQDNNRSAILTGLVLFLVGAAALVLIFLNQSVRVAKRTLERMKLYTRDVIESLPHGLLSVDENGRVASINKQGCKLLGLEHDELVGKQAPDELVGPTTEEGDLTVEWDVHWKTGQGEAIPLKVTGAELTGSEWGSAGRVIVFRDHRRILEMEERLERARRLASLGRMAAGIAHEIRNPLGTLRGFAQYFKGRLADDDKARGYADLMVGEADRMERLISALLGFARPREAEMKSYDLAELLRRGVSLMEGDLAQKGAKIELDSPESMETVGDPDLLLQVLLNLLKNAVQVVGGEGRIVCGGRVGPEEVSFWVEDDAGGLTEEVEARIFDPFFTTRDDGTGLGLAVAHQIVEQHDGAVEVESVKGERTRFTVNYPVATNMEQP